MKSFIVIHHSLTEDGETLSWEAIRRYHVEHHGWHDIGYHLGFEIFDGAPIGLLGRPLMSRAAAAHQQGMNTSGVHVCFVGNYDRKEPSRALLDFAARHLTDITRVLRIDPSSRTIIPHRQVASYKTCPGTMFPLGLLIDQVRHNMPNEDILFV